jgi:hypothetical protein
MTEIQIKLAKFWQTWRARDDLVSVYGKRLDDARQQSTAERSANQFGWKADIQLRRTNILLY